MQGSYGLLISYRKKKKIEEYNKTECIGDYNKWNDAIFASINSGFNGEYKELNDAIFASINSGLYGI